MNASTCWAIAVSTVAIYAAYSGAPVALVSLDRETFGKANENGDKTAARVLAWADKEAAVVGIRRVGGVFSLVVGVIAVVLAMKSLPLFELIPMLLVYAFLVALFGEVLSKIVHRQHADLLAPYSARWFEISHVLFRPFVAMVNGLSRGLSGTNGASPSQISREEILLQLQDPADPELIDPEDHKMIQRVFAITEKTAFECMTPLVEVDAVDAADTVQEAILIAVRNGHTRIPVYEERIDHITGVIYARDLLFGNDRSAKVGTLKKLVPYVPDSKRVDELLQQMRHDREHFVVVVDEYGGSIGIVTIEDLLEELIGDIGDERDGGDADVRRISETEWLLSARISLERFTEATGRSLPQGDYETIAGMLLQILGRIPSKGEPVRVGSGVFQIEVSNERSIQQVRFIGDPL